MILHAGYVASLWPAWRRFARAAADPGRAQRAQLAAILATVAPSAYGRSLGLLPTSTIAEYRRRVPVVTHAALAPYIARIAAGESGVLTTTPVRMLERTSGTTTANKLIPYTDGLRHDFASAVDAWLFDLHRAYPRLVGTRSYWSVSPATRRGEKTDGGVPIGFEDDTAYFGPITRWALARLLAVPSSVARLPTIDQWRRATCLHLLAASDLGLISVWSPSFLTGIMEAIARDLPSLLAELPAARANQIRAKGLTRLTGEALWPRLSLISCWTEGFAKELLPALRRWFPTVAIQPKGLLATEGVVSFPLVGMAGCALALTSHFHEFIDVETPSATPLLAHALRVGGLYAPVLSTRGGLLRYELGDLVRCVGRWRHAPLVTFEGRRDRVSDLCGEKLAEAQVLRAVAALRTALPPPLRFALVAPALHPTPHYAAYIDTDASEDALAIAQTALESTLSEGAHYQYCRSLGQLAPARLRRVRDGLATYQGELLRRGARLGDIKPSSFDTRPIWEEVFDA